MVTAGVSADKTPLAALSLATSHVCYSPVQPPRTLVNVVKFGVPDLMDRVSTYRDERVQSCTNVSAHIGSHADGFQSPTNLGDAVNLWSSLQLGLFLRYADQKPMEATMVMTIQCLEALIIAYTYQVYSCVMTNIITTNRELSTGYCRRSALKGSLLPCINCF